MASIASETYYDVLQVSPTASAEVIEAAYRALQKVAHPDVGGDPARSKLLNQARQALVDPAQRKRYDETLGGRSIPNPCTDKMRLVERSYVICLACGTRNLVNFASFRESKCFTCSRQFAPEAPMSEEHVLATSEPPGPHRPYESDVPMTREEAWSIIEQYEDDLDYEGADFLKAQEVFRKTNSPDATPSAWDLAISRISGEGAVVLTLMCAMATFGLLVITKPRFNLGLEGPFVIVAGCVIAGAVGAFVISVGSQLANVLLKPDNTNSGRKN